MDEIRYHPGAYAPYQRFQPDKDVSRDYARQAEDVSVQRAQKRDDLHVGNEGKRKLASLQSGCHHGYQGEFYRPCAVQIAFQLISTQRNDYRTVFLCAHTACAHAACRIGFVFVRDCEGGVRQIHIAFHVGIKSNKGVFCIVCYEVAYLRKIRAVLT